MTPAPPPVPVETRVYYWIHHTGAYDGNSGVQRVTRALAGALVAQPGVILVPVRWCADRESLVTAEPALVRGLSRFGGPALQAAGAGGEALHIAAGEKRHLDGAWLLLPEVPHVDPDPSRLPAIPVLLDYARYHGLRSAAIFYDLIPLRSPGYDGLRDAHARYAQGLAAADIVLPISRDAARDLTAWWGEQDHRPDRLPRAVPVPLPAEMPGVPRATVARCGSGRQIRLLALGSVEPRKNQIRLMEAVNRLASRRPELNLLLDVVGNVHPAVSTAVKEAERVSGGRIRLLGYLSDAEVAPLTAACDATVFVSLAEGYGLPIAESLWQGKPCICSDVAPMSEIAEGGGCFLVDPTDDAAIEDAVARFATEPALRRDLTEAACARRLSTWNDYGRDVLAALRAAPLVPALVVAEGSLGGGGPSAEALAALGIRVRRLRWRRDTGALIPGFAGEPAGELRPGDGDVRDLWAVIPFETTADAAEAMQMQDELRGLGSRVALVFAPGLARLATDVPTLAGADLTIMADAAERDAMLDAALSGLHRTATLRRRLRVARGAAEIVAELFSERRRLTAGATRDRPRRIYYWAELIRAQEFNTGIQRVVRALGAGLVRLGVELVPVRWDAETQELCLLTGAERHILASRGGPPPSSVESLPASFAGEWLLCPEVTVPSVPAGSNIVAVASRLGMRVASIFYDLLPAKMTDIYPEAVAQAHHAYWAGFAEADVALPISWSVVGDLRRHLAGNGLRVPAIIPCPLGGDLSGTVRRREVRTDRSDGAPLRLLAVGTWEPRKNYPRLIEAVLSARGRSRREVELVVVGRRSAFAPLNAEIERLSAAAAGLSFHHDLSDAALEELYGTCDATVYASWEEGFGLPVLESLWHGLPCLCHDGSSLAEVAPGGGTLSVDMLDVDAIAGGILRLADEPGLLDALSRQAVDRPIRDWTTYAADVLDALARVGASEGWTLPSVSVGGRVRPLLTCAITTYNRAHWLTHGLPRLLAAVKPYGSAIEVVVCDNTSTDATPQVVARHAGTPGLTVRRNPSNLGMLGNLGATARASSGEFVWVIGDDDLVLPQGLEALMSGLTRHPDVEMAYMNYATTSFDAPEQLSDPEEVIRAASPIGYGGPDRRVAKLKEAAALNENLFTAIYACAFRRDHALRAYQQDTSGAAFSSLATCVPSSTYALATLQDRPAWWVGQPAIVINMNVSWLRWALLWHLERMPDLFDLAEIAGLDPVRVDRYRHKHCWNAAAWTSDALLQAEDDIRTGVSVARLIERCKHIPSFTSQLPSLYAAYAAAWRAGRVVADDAGPRDVFQRYGLLDDAI